LKEILGSIKERKDRIKRICVSMITNPRAPEDVLTIAQRIKSEVNIPISLLIAPTVTKEGDFIRFKESGADMVGVAVDAATPEIFESLRGKQVGGPHKWEKYWLTMERAIEVFGVGKVGCHLIVGLGETEEEMLATIQKVRNLGARTHLFSFFPEPGSKLEDHPQPPIGQYRRVQLGRFLIDEGIANFDEFSFDDSGRLLDFGLSYDELSEVIESGYPFMTSGCPGEDGKLACNRPYGDSPPGHDIRSYPFLPEEEDIRRIKEQLWN
jgi:biotin synthase